jgi:hypothetical protein
MPVEGELHDDGHIIHFSLIDPWTLDEVFKGFAHTTKLRDEIHEKNPSQPVHLLLDLTRTKQAPPGIMQARKMPAVVHPTRGEIAVAAVSEFPRAIARAMIKVMQAEGHFFESLDEARDYLRSVVQKSQAESSAKPETAPQSE